MLLLLESWYEGALAGEGEVVEALKLIEGANYGPSQVAVLRQAFEAAWEQIAPSVSARASAIQAARLRLANAVLAAAPNGPMQVERIKADALAAVLAGPRK